MMQTETPVAKLRAVNGDQPLLPTANGTTVRKDGNSVDHHHGLHQNGVLNGESLIVDAKIDAITNKELKKQDHRLNGADSSGNKGGFDASLSPKAFPEDFIEYHVLVSFSEGLVSLSKVIRQIEEDNVFITHIESRKTFEGNNQLFLQIVCAPETYNSLAISVVRCPQIKNVQVLEEKTPEREEIWIPMHITDLNNCAHLMTRFEPDLDHTHPGFTDKTYRKRRKEIAEIAFDYKYGQPIPRIEYTAEETATWGEAYRNLKDLFPTHACKEQVDIFKVMEEECGYCEDKIPQLEDVSSFLKRKTGFQLRPVAGLLCARDFLASLAFRTFQCTQYVRHGAKPDHSPEPDCIHELIGHAPMLARPDFAQFCQELGLASLGVSDEDIEKFTKLYFFTLEFGLCKENGVLKAYGAGILSSYSELSNSLCGNVTLKEFDIEETSIQEYNDADLQRFYFVADSFEDMMKKMRQYAVSLKRPHEMTYDPYTESIRCLDTVGALSDVISDLHRNLDTLAQTIQKQKRRA